MHIKSQVKRCSLCPLFWALCCSASISYFAFEIASWRTQNIRFCNVHLCLIPSNLSWNKWTLAFWCHIDEIRPARCSMLSRDLLLKHSSFQFTTSLFLWAMDHSPYLPNKRCSPQVCLQPFTSSEAWCTHTCWRKAAYGAKCSKVCIIAY